MICLKINFKHLEAALKTCQILPAALWATYPENQVALTGSK